MVQASHTRQDECSPSLTCLKCWSPLSLTAFKAIAPCSVSGCFQALRSLEIHHQHHACLQSSLSLIHITCQSWWLHPSTTAVLWPLAPFLFQLPGTISGLFYSFVSEARENCCVLCTAPNTRWSPCFVLFYSLEKPTDSHQQAEPYHGTSHMPRLTGSLAVLTMFPEVPLLEKQQQGLLCPAWVIVFLTQSFCFE